MPAAKQVLKIQLPTGISAFTFTFKMKGLGPVSVEISLPQPVSSPPGVLVPPSPAHLSLPIVLHSPGVIDRIPHRIPLLAGMSVMPMELPPLPVESILSFVVSTSMICPGQSTAGNLTLPKPSTVSAIVPVDKIPVEDSETEPESEDEIQTQALTNKFKAIHGTGKCSLCALSVDSFAEDDITCVPQASATFIPDDPTLPDIGPILYGFPIPSHKQHPLAPLNPDLWSLSAPNTQDSMLGANLDLGIDFPNLMSKVPNPGGILAALDYFLNYNADDGSHPNGASPA
ncbi:hypothetical protein V8B97DRAFT_1920111 [Scleroderma yunnanense]